MTLFACMCLALILLLAGGAAAVPERWGSAEVSRPCEDFDRGNVRRDSGSWGPEGWCILNAGEMPNQAAYDIEVSGGWYQLLVRHAARDSRPVELLVDGEPQARICGEITGTWRADSADWFEAALLQLDGGSHELEFRRTGPFPHLDHLALVPLPIDISTRLNDDGTWMISATGQKGTVVRRLQVNGEALGREGRVLPGVELWLLLAEPERKAGPIVLPNLDPSSRLRRLREWIGRCDVPKEQLAAIVTDDRAEETLGRIDSAKQEVRRIRQDLAALRDGEETGDVAALRSNMDRLLARIHAIERDVRGPTQVALGSIGRAHEGLRKRGYYTIVGNQMVATCWTRNLDANGRPIGPRQFHPGLMSLSYYPPPKLTFFSVSPPAAELHLRRNGKRVQVIRDEHADDWHPHALHTEYLVEGGGRLVQDLCIADDTAIARIGARGVAGDTEAYVTGKAIGRTVTDRRVGDDGVVTLTFESRGRELTQAVTASGVRGAQLQGDGYVTELGTLSDRGGEMVIAAAIRPTPESAREAAVRWLDKPCEAFADAEGVWARYFSEELPRFACSDPRLMDLYYTIGYVLRADRYDVPPGGQWDHPYVVPSKWTWRGIWPEDLSHCLTGLRWLNDPEAAYGCLRVIRDHFFRPDAKPTAKVHAYGLLTVATHAVFERYGDLGFLREMYPTLRGMNDFIAGKCDSDGDGLPEMHDSFKLGWDSSRRFDCDGNLVDRRFFKKPLEPVDCAVYFQRQSALLARLARALESDGDVEQLTRRASKTWQAINEYMWDDDTGFFYDLFAEDNERCGIKSCAGIFPLLGGDLDGTRRRAVLEHLRNVEEFWARYPVPCVAMDEPQFGSVWSGASCLRNNWLIYRGLLDCEMPQVAADLTERTLALLYLTPPETVNEGYYFDPRTGRAAAGELGNLFSTPLAGVLDMIFTGACGLRPAPDGEWRVEPLPELEPDWWALSNIEMAAGRATVSGESGHQPQVRYE